jgi:hypothetical protein
MNATIELVSPSGVPVTLSVTKDDTQEDIIATLERADKIGAYFAKHGWGFAAQPAALPSAAELDQGPTFCGYRCSPTVDDRGLPSWIVVDGQQAMRREKQGDVWWSIKTSDGSYEQVLRIPKGEQAPKVKGI